MTIKERKKIDEEYNFNKLIPLNKIGISKKTVIEYIVSNYDEVDIFYSINFFENENNFDYLKYFPKEISNNFFKYYIEKFYQENNHYPISLSDFKNNFSVSFNKIINNYGELKKFYQDFVLMRDIKQKYPYIRTKDQFLLEQININYKKIGKNIAPFFGEEIEDKYIKDKIEQFHKEHKRYPIYIDEFKNPNNDLPTTYRGASIVNFNEIIKIYQNIFNSSTSEVEQFLIKENLKLFSIVEYRKFFKFENLKEDNSIYRKIYLYAMEYYKYKHNKYPEYKDIKKTHYFPFITGMPPSYESIEYNILFKENEIMDYFDFQEDKKNLFFEELEKEMILLNEYYIGIDNKIIFEDEFEDKNKKEIKVSNEVEQLVFLSISSLFEQIKNNSIDYNDFIENIGDKINFKNNFKQIIHLFSTSLIQELNQDNYYDLYKDISLNIETLFYSLENNNNNNNNNNDFSSKTMKELKNKTNFDIINLDIINIMNIVLLNFETSEYKDFNLFIKDSEFIDLNTDVKKNMKGYDYLFITPDKKEIYLSYKYKTGRSFANLSIENLFGEDLIETSSNEYQNLQRLLQNIDSSVKELKIIDPIFKNKINYLFEYLEKNLDDVKQFGDLNKIIFKLLNNEKILDNFEIDNFLIEDKRIEISSSKKEIYDFNNNVNKLIIYDVFKIIQKNKYTVVEFLDKKEEIIDKISNKLIKKPFLEHSLLTIENNKLKTEYKYIIKSIYRNDQLINKISEKLNLKQGFDISIYNYYLTLYKNKLNNYFNNLKGIELDNFLNTLLHLENINKSTHNYVIGNGEITELLSFQLIDFIKEDIKIKVKNFQTKRNGVQFDFTLFYKDIPLIELNKNIIKSKQGKLMYGHLIDFATSFNFVLNNELIQKIKLEMKETIKETIKERGLEN